MENPDVVFIKVDVDYCEDLGLDFQAKLPVVSRAPPPKLREIFHSKTGNAEKNPDVVFL